MKKRKELVRRFQDDEAISFFVLSLKAGGAGLNLTAARRTRRVHHRPEPDAHRPSEGRAAGR